MTTLLVLFNLKSGVSDADYEAFAKTLDIPTVTSLKSVSDFKVYKSYGIFGSDATPPYRYFEIIHFSTVDELVGDIGAEPKMAEIPIKFAKMADSPLFILTKSIE